MLGFLRHVQVAAFDTKAEFIGMRPIPSDLPVMTAVNAVALVLAVWLRRCRGSKRGTAGFNTLIVTSVFLVFFWAWLLISTPAPATGDPRSRGGYNPAEQQALVE
jgi:hypothetical protein